MSDKQVKRVKVYCKNTIYIEGDNNTVKKIKAGAVALLTPEEIKHFAGKVTKDIPEELDQ